MDSKTGRVIWHDLFTANLNSSMEFYGKVAGWAYKTEHATDFAWGGGEKNFVLALFELEAGAGFTETPQDLPVGWIPYVEVVDVDATVALSEKLGGAIVRAPFEVPGVGRNALLRDPHGALFGVSLSRHSFPAPTKQFSIEIYAGNEKGFPAAFYSAVFDWKTGEASNKALGESVIGASGDNIAEVIAGEWPGFSEPLWMPNLKVAHFNASLKKAEDLGVEVLCRHLDTLGELDRIVLNDPCGSVFSLQRFS